MLPILVLALIAWPFVEILAALQVADMVGILATVALLVLLSLLGTLLLRRQGTAAVTRVRGAWRAGRLPAPELVDGSLRVTGAFLLAVPGFVSAAAGLLLLLPPVRIGARRMILGRLERRLVVVRRRRLRAPRADVVTVDVVAAGGPGATSVIRRDDHLEDEFFGDMLPAGPVAVVPDVPGVPLPPPSGPAAPVPPGVPPPPPESVPPPAPAPPAPVSGVPPPPAPPPPVPAPGEGGGAPAEVLAPGEGPVDLDIPDRRFRKRRKGKR